MGLRPGLSLLVHPLDVGLELSPVDAPDPASTEFDGRKIPRSDERIDLGHADVEIGRNIFEGQESGFDTRSFPRALGAHVSDDNTVTCQIHVSEPVWLRLGA